MNKSLPRKSIENRGGTHVMHNKQYVKILKLLDIFCVIQMDFHQVRFEISHLYYVYFTVISKYQIIAITKLNKSIQSSFFQTHIYLP